MSLRTMRLLVLSFSCVSVACSGKENASAFGEAQGATLTQAAPTSVVQQRPAHDTRTTEGKKLAALFDSIVAEAKGLPRVEFDPAALAATLGRDPRAHFEWVRDHTWWAPYRGLLRGPRGVMLDRVGSSLDRAVLLGQLLRHAGYTVRLAHAEIPSDRAKTLLEKVRSFPDRQFNANEEQRDSTDRIVEAARGLVRSQSDQLYAFVQFEAEKAVAAQRLATVAALRDHWWIECSIENQWTALDVLHADSRPGDTVVQASARYQWNADDAAPSIEESDWHTVQIRVVVERLQDGATRESPVLETTLRPADVLDRPVTLVHVPKQWPEVSPDTSTDPNALGNAAVNVKEWVPVLRIGDDVVLRSGFTDGGVVIDDALESKDEVQEAGGGGLFGGLDSALAGGETPTSYMTAEWLDYEIRVPGAKPQRLRRPVFDVLGPAKRSAKSVEFDGSSNDLLVERYQALLGVTDIFLQPCELSGEFVASLASGSIISREADFHALATESDPAKARALALSLLERTDTWGPLLNLALWRSTLGQRDWFVDRPNILNYRAGLPVVNADRVAIHQMIDIASNSVGVHYGATFNPSKVRVQQGVADTVAELVTLHSDLRATENTASIFAQSVAERSDVVVVGSKSTLTPDLDWPQNPTAAIAEDLDDGYVAVALRRPVKLQGRMRVAWWRIDPVSGETVGVMDTGLHSSTTETSIPRAKVALNQMREFMRRNARYISEVRRQAGYGTPDKALLKEAQLYKKIANLIKEVDAMGGL
jgi:hypothetical protein